jgi:hypothetical protein
MADRQARPIERGDPDWRDGAVERLEILSAAAPAHLGLDAAQKAAWGALMTGLRDQLETGMAAIDSIRPAFDAFYGSLDEDQRARIETVLAGGRRR